MALLCGQILGWLQKTYQNNSSIDLTVIQIFGAVIEQLSSAIEIMVNAVMLVLVTKLRICFNAVE